MWKTRKGDSEQSLQKKPKLGRFRNACDRNDPSLQIDWEEEKRVLGRPKETGKKEYNKSFEDLETRLDVLLLFLPDFPCVLNPFVGDFL